MTVHLSKLLDLVDCCRWPSNRLERTFLGSGFLQRRCSSFKWGYRGQCNAPVGLAEATPNAHLSELSLRGHHFGFKGLLLIEQLSVLAWLKGPPCPASLQTFLLCRTLNILSLAGTQPKTQLCKCSNSYSEYYTMRLTCFEHFLFLQRCSTVQIA